MSLIGGTKKEVARQCFEVFFKRNIRLKSFDREAAEDAIVKPVKEAYKNWHLNSGLDETYRVIPDAHLSDVLSLAIHKQILVSGGEDRTIKLWNLETAEKQQPHILRGHAGSIWCVAISPDGRKIASASGDYTVKIWDLKTGQMLETLTGHLGEVRTVAFSPDGQMLASAGDDWEIKLWQLDD